MAAAPIAIPARRVRMAVFMASNAGDPAGDGVGDGAEVGDGAMVTVHRAGMRGDPCRSTASTGGLRRFRVDFFPPAGLRMERSGREPFRVDHKHVTLPAKITVEVNGVTVE
jgi:hypothetical protein